MENKKIIKLYEEVEQNVKKISDNAYKAFKERDDAIQGIESTMSFFGSFGLGGGISTSSLKQSGVEELKKDMRSFAKQLEKEIQKITKQLQELYDSLEDIEAIYYLVDGISKLFVHTKKLDYTVAGMGTYGGCHCVVENAYDTWKTKIDNDTNLYKRSLEQAIVRNEKMLQEKEKEIGKSQKTIAKLQEELVDLMQTYGVTVQKLLEKEYGKQQKIQEEIEKNEKNLKEKQEELLSQIKEKNSSSGRKKKEAQFCVESTQKDIKKIEEQLENNQSKLDEVVKYVMAAAKECDNAIDKKRQCIFQENEQLELAKKVVNDCKNNIERIKGELNV